MTPEVFAQTIEEVKNCKDRTQLVELFLLVRRQLQENLVDDLLLRLLEEVSDYEQTPEEAEKELREEGVDVEVFMNKVHKAIDEVYDNPLKLEELIAEELPLCECGRADVVDIMNRLCRYCQEDRL